MKFLFTERQWYAIDTFLVSGFYDTVIIQIRKHSYLFFDFRSQGSCSPTNKDACMDTKFSQFDNRMLQRLSLHLTRCGNIYDRNHMNKKNIFFTKFPSKLPHCLYEMWSFYISNRSSDLYNSDIFAFSNLIDP